MKKKLIGIVLVIVMMFSLSTVALADYEYQVGPPMPTCEYGHVLCALNEIDWTDSATVYFPDDAQGYWFYFDLSEVLYGFTWNWYALYNFDWDYFWDNTWNYNWTIFDLRLWNFETFTIPSDQFGPGGLYGFLTNGGTFDINNMCMFSWDGNWPYGEHYLYFTPGQHDGLRISTVLYIGAVELTFIADGSPFVGGPIRITFTSDLLNPEDVVQIAQFLYGSAWSLGEAQFDGEVWWFNVDNFNSWGKFFAFVEYLIVEQGMTPEEAVTAAAAILAQASPRTGDSSLSMIAIAFIALSALGLAAFSATKAKKEMI